MTRDVVAAAVVVILVGWAFYSTLGGHAEPKPGAAGVHDLTGMTNPHVTQQNIRSTMCRRGWDISVRPSSAQIWQIKRFLLHGRRASDYELDHIIPIGLGGAVLDRRNLQLVLTRVLFLDHRGPLNRNGVFRLNFDVPPNTPESLSPSA
jgi:hypothetical protein